MLTAPVGKSIVETSLRGCLSVITVTTQLASIPSISSWDCLAIIQEIQSTREGCTTSGSRPLLLNAQRDFGNCLTATFLTSARYARRGKVSVKLPVSLMLPTARLVRLLIGNHARTFSDAQSPHHSQKRPPHAMLNSSNHTASISTRNNSVSSSSPLKFRFNLHLLSA